MNNGIYTMASPSTSSLYGNVGCAIRELILSKFPRNYFKYTNVSTEVAFRNLRRQFGRNTNNEIKKRRMPYLVLQPSYQAIDWDGTLQSIPLTKNIDDLQFGVNPRTLFDVIRDKNNGYNLRFKMNRDKIEYEVRIVVSTLHQQLDLYKTLVNQIVWERSYYNRGALEAIIPKSIINCMGKLCNIDIESKPELIPIFIKHLNTVSAYPITYKLRNASATDEYYMYYMHNIVVTFTDLSIDEGSKRNMADDYFTITFRVNAEFNLPGLFLIDANVNKIKNLKFQLASANKLPLEDDPDVDYIPLYTVSNLYNNYPNIKDGMEYYGSSRFVTNVHGTVTDDEVEISDIFDTNHQRVIRFYTGYHIKPDTLVKVYMLKDNDELEENVDFIMDWNKFSAIVKNADNKATYRIIIYINRIMYNDMIAEMHDNDLYDKYKLADNTIDWNNIFSSTEIATYVMTNDIFDDNAFHMNIDGIDYSLGNMYNINDGLSNNQYNADKIKEDTIWTGIFGDTSDFFLRTTVYDDEKFEYSFVDPDGSKHWLVNFKTREPNKIYDSYIMAVDLWEEILDFDTFKLVTSDIDYSNQYYYMMSNDDGSRSYVTNFVDHVEGKVYEPDVLQVNAVWENILSYTIFKLVTTDIDDSDEFPYMITNEDGTRSHLANFVDKEEGKTYSDDVIQVTNIWEEILNGSTYSKLTDDDLDDNMVYEF